MVSYDEPVVAYHGCVTLRQWLGMIVSYAEPAGVNHGVLFSASGCESW